jgi:transcriptional repressor NrdR
MRCPFCKLENNKVVDSRASNEAAVIRRRRHCEACGRRFTTYERVEEILPLVVKKDGRREAFNRMKIIAGLRKACEKRPVSTGVIEEMADRVERYLQEKGEKEVPSSVIGEEVMRQLHDLDKVAYVRFASVYRSFPDLDAFMRELKELSTGRRANRRQEPTAARTKAHSPA